MYIVVFLYDYIGENPKTNDAAQLSFYLNSLFKRPPIAFSYKNSCHFGPHRTKLTRIYGNPHENIQNSLTQKKTIRILFRCIFKFNVVNKIFSVNFDVSA